MRLRFQTAMLATVLTVSTAFAQQPPALDAKDRELAHDIFKQLIEINTTDSVGNVTTAAKAMQQRLLDAGFSADDLYVGGPNDRKGNLVARYRGAAESKLKPILLICHLDVVEARREDWTTDPFQFVEKAGYYYGRGTQDIKEDDADLVTNFIRLKREGYVPDRDIIIALTSDEEGGKANGVDWLLKNHRELIDADFVLNPDAGGATSEKGKVIDFEVEATEKLYADYQVSAKNPGGHSSVPRADNAIYQVTDALSRLEKSPFPFELNPVTRTYFAKMASIEHGQTSLDMRAILKSPPDAAAIARLSKDPRYNSTMRTTCVATMLKAGHAPNALPQSAEANVNCRILPGHSQEEIRQKLIGIFHDDRLTVCYVDDAGVSYAAGSDRKAMTPPPPRADVFDPLSKVVAELWPGVPVVPVLSTGASDSIYTMQAGIPSYGISGMAIDADDDRAHGKDERIRVEAFYTGVEFYYLYLKALTTK